MDLTGPGTTYHLSLGSNLWRPGRNLARAVGLLRERSVEIVRASSVYRTEPVDLPAQPWFMNQVVEVRTGLDPFALLGAARSIEAAMKRVRAAPKGPRTIDIDILLAGDLIVETEALTIPHPRMAFRNFVLVPLAEIAPDLVHPILQVTVRDILRRCRDTSAVVRIS